MDIYGLARWATIVAMRIGPELATAADHCFSVHDTHIWMKFTPRMKQNLRMCSYQVCSIVHINSEITPEFSK